MTNTNTQLHFQLIRGPVSPEEEKIVLANLDKTNAVIGSMLSRSEASIRQFLYKNGIKRTSDQDAKIRAYVGKQNLGTANGNYKHGEGNNPYHYKKKHAHKHRKKARARNIVYKAKRAGLLVQKNVCEKCGSAGPTEFHHPDYDKPLEVQELCTYCHMLADEERRIKENELNLKWIETYQSDSISQDNRPEDSK